jgi:hypothetical protein
LSRYAPAARRHIKKQRNPNEKKSDFYVDLLQFPRRTGRTNSAYHRFRKNGVGGRRCQQQDKLVIRFKEEDSKLLVVSATKFDAIALIAKSDETDDWPGVKIVLEAGKASFQGKLVDSISIRAPRKPPSPKRATAAVAEDEAEFDDEIEF